jgi:hypothetical protein
VQWLHANGSRLNAAGADLAAEAAKVGDQEILQVSTMLM